GGMEGRNVRVCQFGTRGSRVDEEGQGKPGTCCPRCVVPVVRECGGRHQGQECELPRSHNDLAFSCELPWGYPLVMWDPPCAHPCPEPCHPGSCPPCKNPLRKRCYCGIMTHAIECGQWGAATEAERVKMVSCTGPCHKKLPFCSHMCVEMCHPGPCPKPTQCRKKVTVRCACLRLKKEWLCSHVQTGTAKAAANGASNPTTGPLFYAAPPLPSLPVCLTFHRSPCAVTVRCACLRLKKEWLCSQVQSATAKAAANGASNPSSSIDCSTNASSSGGGGGGGRLRESMYKGGTASSSRSSRGLGGFDLKQMLL
ncbi:unnamed protein product, partial [Closterium sp. NIES-64]